MWSRLQKGVYHNSRYFHTRSPLSVDVSISHKNILPFDGYLTGLTASWDDHAVMLSVDTRTNTKIIVYFDRYIADFVTNRELDSWNFLVSTPHHSRDCSRDQSQARISTIPLAQAWSFVHVLAFVLISCITSLYITATTLLPVSTIHASTYHGILKETFYLPIPSKLLSYIISQKTVFWGIYP